MMAPKHITSNETSQPLNRATQWDRETRGHMACLDHQAPGQTGQEGADGPPGSGADNGPPVQPNGNDDRITSSPTDNRAGELAYPYYTHALGTSQGSMQKDGTEIPYCTNLSKTLMPGRVAQSVTCLVTDAKLTADPGVASSIPARCHTFVEIDHEIISTVILLSSAESFMKGCCQLQAKVCAQLLVNCLFKLAQEKSVVR